MKIHFEFLLCRERMKNIAWLMWEMVNICLLAVIILCFFFVLFLWYMYKSIHSSLLVLWLRLLFVNWTHIAIECAKNILKNTKHIKSYADFLTPKFCCCLSISMCVCVCVYIYMYVCVYIYIHLKHTHIYIYIYTYTHTHTHVYKTQKNQEEANNSYHFDVGRTVHHHTIQINQPTSCNSVTSLLLDVLCRSTCFGRLHAYHQELTTALTASGFT